MGHKFAAFWYNLYIKAYEPLAELHAHLGTSIRPSVLWEIANNHGIKLKAKTYQDFKNSIRLSPNRRVALNTYFKQTYGPILDKLSSGTGAVEHATFQIMTGAYRASNIRLIELRNNPMKHNGDNSLDLDHIIVSMLHGMERALLAHRDLSAGLIFCMAREFSLQQNTKILNKAIKYRRRGIVGIDVAGPGGNNFRFKDYQNLFDKARRAGLGVTVHSGEQADALDMWDAIKYAKPSRIGHGIQAANDPKLMAELAKRQIVLEVCPLSNLMTKAVANVEEMRFILRQLIKHKVPFCINTDWPEIIEGARMSTQNEFLLTNKLMTAAELEQCNQTAFKASFIPKTGNLKAYL